MTKATQTGALDKYYYKFNKIIKANSIMGLNMVGLSLVTTGMYAPISLKTIVGDTTDGPIIDFNPMFDYINILEKPKTCTTTVIYTKD